MNNGCVYHRHLVECRVCVIYSCHATSLRCHVDGFVYTSATAGFNSDSGFFLRLAHTWLKYTHSTCGRTLLEWWLAMPCKRLSRSRSLAQSCTLSFSRYVTDMTSVPFIPFVYILPHWVPRLSNRTRTTLHTTRTSSVVWVMLSVSKHADP